MWDQVKNPENLFSHNEAHISDIIASQTALFYTFELPQQGIQRSTVLVVNFFRIFEILFVCFVVAIVYLVQDVEAIFHRL